MNIGYKELAKKNVQKFFGQLKKGHFYVPRNVQNRILEKLFKK